MKDFNAKFEESSDGYQSANPGKYPSHVSAFDVRTFETGSKVFNIEFTLAEECKNMEVEKYQRSGNEYIPFAKDGKVEIISAGFMTGKKYFSAGVWLTPNLAKEERWKNRKYKEFFSNIGIEFPTDKDGIVELQEVEEEDVIGMPALVDVQSYTYTNKDGEEKTSLRVLSVFPWNDGNRIEPPKDTDVPF
jgi:hypothetical protein